MANLGGIKVECVETAPPLKKYRGFFFLGVRERPVHRLASRPWIFKTILLLEGSEIVSPLCGPMPSKTFVNLLCPV